MNWVSKDDAEEMLEVELSDLERRVLHWGVIDWGGPARCTEEMAVALGFLGVDDFVRHRKRLADAVKGGQPLSRLDWARVVLATEVVFASDVMGSGLDWAITSGFSDVETLSALRTIQRKVRWTRRLIGNGLGTVRRP